MLFVDIIENGCDGDGDGWVDLKGLLFDVLVLGVVMLLYLGWWVGEFWL